MKSALGELRSKARDCRACPLYANATQTVFGEGSDGARVMLVGEQPGDHEDEEGRPFVGPAGRLLSEALTAAGLPRESIYLTNTVKHFKWEARGKRRIHQKPNAAEVAACMPWLLAEIAAVQPQIVVALGATAAQALLGRTFKVTVERGRLVNLPDGRPALATIHPSALLRMPDREARADGLKHLVADLSVAARAVTRPPETK